MLFKWYPYVLQAPKKKGGKKKGKGSAKGPAIIDGVAVADMTREQVEGHLERLREELNREREERNYFQLERDKINTFWEISRQQLDDARAEIRRVVTSHTSIEKTAATSAQYILRYALFASLTSVATVSQCCLFNHWLLN